MTTHKTPKTRPKRVLFGLLETHFSVPFFALMLLGMIWFGAIHTINREEAGLEQEAVKTTLALSEVYEAQMVRNLGFIDQTLKTVKYAYERDPNPDVLGEMDLKGLLPPRLVFAISLVGTNGNIIASNSSRKWEHITNRAWLPGCRSKAGNMHINFVAPEKSGEELVYFCRRLESKSGALLGTVMVSVSPGYFSSGYEIDRLGKRGLLGLVSNEGQFIVRRTGEQHSAGEKAAFLSEMKNEKTGNSTFLLKHDIDNVERYTHVRQLYGYPLTIVIGLSKEEKLAAFNEKRKQYLLLAGAASVLLLIGTALLAQLSWQLEQSRRSVRKKQQTYYAASEASLDAMFVLRAEPGIKGEIRDFVLENVNQRGAQLFGVGKAEVTGMRLTHMLPQCRANGIFDDLASVYQTGQQSETEWQSDQPVLKGRWLYRQVVCVEDGVVVIMRDITERKKEEARMVHLATHDVLTGLPNRALLYERVEAAILQAKTNQRMVAVLFVDLDHFKEVNDTHGHKVGDELLKIISVRIQNCLRQGDMVSRLGGDEFVLVLGNQSDLESMVVPTVERIRKVVSEPVHLGGLTLNVTSSVGLAVYPEHGEDGETLLSHADMAMYDAKSRGRNKFRIYSDMEMASVG